MPESTEKRADKTTKSLPVFDRDRCKQCGICAHFCPKGVMDIEKDGFPRIVDPDACNECRLCEHLCPDFGIEIGVPGNSEPREATPETRANGSRSDLD